MRLKQFTHIIAATGLSGIILIGLFASGILEYKTTNVQKKTISIAQLTKDVTPQTVNSLSYIQHIQKGDDYVKSGMKSLAVNEYIAANQQQPENTEPYLKIGDILLKEKDYAKAQEIYQQLLMKNSENPEANFGLVKTYILLRNVEKANELLKTLPDSQMKFYYTGLIASFAGQYDIAKTALAAATKAVAGNSASEDIAAKANNVLSVYDEYGLNQGSQEIFLKTLIAKSFNQIEEYTLSIPLLFNVVKEKKDYRDAWILLGYAYLNTEDNKDAIDALQEAKKLDRNKPETLFFLGLALSANNQKDEAVQEIEDAIGKGFEPKIQAQQKLAEIYLEKNDFARAAGKYEAVLALNDKDMNYYVRPMWLYISKLNTPARALILAQHALTTHPNTGMGYNLVGWAQMALNDDEAAKVSLAKAIEIDPKMGAAYLNLGQLYEKQLNTEMAKQYYQTAFKLSQGSSVGDTAAASYNRLIAATNPTTVPSPLSSIGTSGQANILQPMDTQPTVKAKSPQAPEPMKSSEIVPKFKLPSLTTTP